MKRKLYQVSKRKLYRKIGEELGVEEGQVYRLLTGHKMNVNGFPGVYADLYEEIDQDLRARLFQKLVSVLSQKINSFKIFKELFEEPGIRQIVKKKIANTQFSALQRKVLACFIESEVASLKELSRATDIELANLPSQLRECAKKLSPVLESQTGRRAIVNIAERRRRELFKYLAGHLSEFKEALDGVIKKAAKTVRGIGLTESQKIELIQLHLYEGMTYRALGVHCGKSDSQVKHFFNGTPARRPYWEGAISIMQRFMSQELEKRAAHIMRQLVSEKSRGEEWIAAFDRIVYWHTIYQVPFSRMCFALKTSDRAVAFVSKEAPSRETVTELMRTSHDITFFGAPDMLDNLWVTEIDRQAVERWRQWSRDKNHEDESMVVRLCRRGLIWIMLPESGYRANMTHALRHVPLRTKPLVLPSSWQRHHLMTAYQVDQWPCPTEIPEKTGVLGFFSHRHGVFAYLEKKPEDIYVLVSSTTGRKKDNRVRHQNDGFYIKEQGKPLVEMYEHGKGKILAIRTFRTEEAGLSEKGLVDMSLNPDARCISLSEEDVLMQYVFRWMDDVLEDTRDVGEKNKETVWEILERARNHYLNISERFEELNKDRQNVPLKELLQTLGDVLTEPNILESSDTLIAQGNLVHKYIAAEREKLKASLFKNDRREFLLKSSGIGEQKKSASSAVKGEGDKDKQRTVFINGEEILSCAEYSGGIKVYVDEEKQSSAGQPTLRIMGLNKSQRRSWCQRTDAFLGRLRYEFFSPDMMNLDALRGKTVVVMGCGGGTAVKEMRRYGINAFGLDIVLSLTQRQEMLHDTSLANPEHKRIMQLPTGQTDKIFIAAHAAATGIKSGSVDFIYETQLFFMYLKGLCEHFEMKPYLQKVVQEWEKILKPGGKIRLGGIYESDKDRHRAFFNKVPGLRFNCFERRLNTDKDSAIEDPIGSVEIVKINEKKESVSSPVKGEGDKDNETTRGAPVHWREQWPVPEEAEFRRARRVIEYIIDYIVEECHGADTVSSEQLKELTSFPTWPYGGANIWERARTFRAIYYLEPDIAGLLISSVIGLHERWSEFLDPEGCEAFVEVSMLGEVMIRGLLFCKKDVFEIVYNDKSITIDSSGAERSNGLMKLLTWFGSKTRLSLIENWPEAYFDLLVNAMVRYIRVTPRDIVYDILENIPRQRMDRIKSKLLPEVRDFLLSRDKLSLIHPPPLLQVERAEPRVPGTAVGKLVVFSKEPDLDELRDIAPEFIVAMPFLPIPTSGRPVGPFAGMLTFVQEGETSHAMARAHLWKVPHALWPGPASLRQFEGKEEVILEVTEDAVNIREATEADAAAHKEKSKHIEVEFPSARLDGEEYFLSPGSQQLCDPEEVGYKVAFLNQLASQPPEVEDPLIEVNLATGSAFPFRTFTYLLEKAGVADDFKESLHDLRGDDRSIKSALFNIEYVLAQIKGSINYDDYGPSSDKLWEAFLARNKLWEEFVARGGESGFWKKGFFVRSATNVENPPSHPGFGAGLYRTVPHVIGEDNFWKAVISVYSSVWREPAFWERQRVGIDESMVFPAVWFVPSIPADYAFVLHTSKSRKDNSTLMEVAQGLGEAVVGSDPMFAGFPTRILFDKQARTVLRQRPSRKKRQSILAQAGGTLIAPVDPQKEFLKHPDAQRLIRATAAAGAQAENFFARPLKIEGALVHDAVSGRWTMHFFQTGFFSPLR
ncbi:MAG: methyltransferase domain-containing protein [Candidatus Omnitrophica bacterium]|nr:methyltransferase domain-containing protein [Candidatus Omnitrophota bacterium]